MEVNNLDSLVKSVTDNILNQIDIEIPSNRINNKSCLILIPNITLGFIDYINYIIKKFPDYEIYISSNETMSSEYFTKNYHNIYYVKYDYHNQMFINLINSVQNIIVVGPKISQLKALTNLDDSEGINNIVISSLMTNRPIELLINSNELMFNKILNIINGITKMGIKITNIQQNKLSVLENTNLITESYVQNLKNIGSRTILLNKKQLITPLAKDKIREAKIIIKYIEEEE